MNGQINHRDGDPTNNDPSNLEILGGAIRAATEHGRGVSFEVALSALTFAIGSIERIKALDPDQQDRLTRTAIRLANVEKKACRGCKQLKAKTYD